MSMRDQITRVVYPLHSLATGPVEIVSFSTDSSRLAGRYLDYALACVAGYEAISLIFIPGFTPHDVRVGSNFSDLESWSPTRNADLARKLVMEYLNKDVVDVSAQDLVEIVTSRIGSRVTLLKPTKDFSESNLGEA